MAVIESLARRTTLCLQVGGGVRSAALIEKLLSAEPELVYVIVFVGDPESARDVAWASVGPIVEGFDLTKPLNRAASPTASAVLLIFCRLPFV